MQGRRGSAESCPAEGAVFSLRALVTVVSVDNIRYQWFQWIILGTSGFSG